MAAVIDASALAAYLVDDTVGPAVASALAGHDGELHLPHLAAVEVVSVLRGLVRAGDLSPARVEMALTDLADFPALRWGHEQLLARIWGLRDDVSAYDAAYVALAEGLHATLLTHDARLASAAAAHASCPIHLV